MASTLAPSVAAPHQERVQIDLRLPRGVVAKADLKKVQKRAAWQRDAEACATAIGLSRLSRKEVAARLGLTESGLAAQLAAAERPQTELFRSDDVLRGPFVIAQALQDPDRFDVITTITVRRSA
ncbi:MAG: hypothetical protein AB7P99_10520 [Vicinamibacterales bacterium]